MPISLRVGDAISLKYADDGAFFSDGLYPSKVTEIVCVTREKSSLREKLKPRLLSQLHTVGPEVGITAKFSGFWEVREIVVHSPSSAEVGRAEGVSFAVRPIRQAVLLDCASSLKLRVDISPSCRRKISNKHIHAHTHDV